MKNESDEDDWNSFLLLCSKIKTPDEFNALFSLFFTYEERATIASRYAIIKALLDGEMTQREIAEHHRVSIAQITRGSNALKIVDTNFKKFLAKKL